MKLRRFGAELCWCAATLLAMAGYGLLLAWIDSGTAAVVSPARDALLVLSVGSIILMIALVVVAFRVESSEDAHARDSARDRAASA